MEVAVEAELFGEPRIQMGPVRAVAGVAVRVPGGGAA